jgi:hypothetical protein
MILWFKSGCPHQGTGILCVWGRLVWALEFEPSLVGAVLCVLTS